MTTEETVMTDVTGGLLPRDDLAAAGRNQAALGVRESYAAADVFLSLLRSPEVVERAARTLAEHIFQRKPFMDDWCDCGNWIDEGDGDPVVEHARHVAEVLLGEAGGAPETVLHGGPLDSDTCLCGWTAGPDETVADHLDYAYDALAESLEEEARTEAGGAPVEHHIEIGGQRMTQAQFDAARYPLLRGVCSHQERKQMEAVYAEWGGSEDSASWSAEGAAAGGAPPGMSNISDSADDDDNPGIPGGVRPTEPRCPSEPHSPFDCPERSR